MKLIFFLLMCGFAGSTTVTAEDVEVEVTKVKVSTKQKSKQEKPAKKKQEFPKFKTTKALLAAYQKAWKKEDYKLMYMLISREGRWNMSFLKFKDLFERDRKNNGGISKIIELKELKKNGSKISFQAVLEYDFKVARKKNIRFTVVREKDEFYFINSGGLLPPDYSKFNR